MDPLAQALVGAALAQSFSAPKKGLMQNEARAAFIAGALSGMSCDLDIFIRSSTDSLLALEFHRHFTHSLFFTPLGALICTLFLWPFFLSGPVSFKRLYTYCFLGIVTHGLLDACTSYGTRLFWPLNNTRVALSNVAVIDPFMEIPLLLIMIAAFIKRSRVWAMAGMTFSLLYLGFGYLQNQKAQTLLMNLAKKRGHTPTHLEVHPTLGNLSLWRGLYEVGDDFYVDALWLWPGFKPKIYPGGTGRKLVVEKDFAFLPKDGALYKDLERFSYFSKGKISYDPRQSDVIGDLRYSFLPQSTNPLWGIRVDLNKPYQGAHFENFNDPKYWPVKSAKEMWALYWPMVLGR